jgi:hypothetical protein
VDDFVLSQGLRLPWTTVVFVMVIEAEKRKICFCIIGWIMVQMRYLAFLLG